MRLLLIAGMLGALIGGITHVLVSFGYLAAGTVLGHHWWWILIATVVLAGVRGGRDLSDLIDDISLRVG